MIADNFENLLGRNVSNISLKLNCTFENNIINKNLYYANIKDERCFYALNYNIISLMTDDENNVQSITLHFNEIIDKEFYRSFNIDYDVPNSILVVVNKKHTSRVDNIDGLFNQELKESNLEIKEGEFMDKPTFIIWRKKGYQINMLFRYDQNTSEITFSKELKK